jgi:DNA-binding transcriptional LysR family regulator
MADLSLIGLRVLREVAAQGTFTGAAESLGYTQSAISRQIAALEDAAGTPLFERRARGVTLTDAGGALLRHAGAVLDEVEAARRDLEGLSAAATSRLRLGAFPTAAAALLPRAVAGFRERRPGVDVSLREGSTPSQLRRVSSSGVDAAVVGFLPGSSRGRDRRVALEHLLDDPLLLAVGPGHRLARRRSVEIDELVSESWVAATAKADDTLLGAWQWAEWRPRVDFVARDWTAKLGLVASNLGVTLVPGLAADAVRPDVGLVRIRTERQVNRAVFVATRSAPEPAGALSSFIERLHETAAELASELQGRVSRR